MDQHENDRQPARSQDDYLKLSRLISANHWRTEAKKSKGKSTPYKIRDFLTKRIWSWFYYYIINRFGPNCSYPAYTGADNGIYKINDADTPTKIAIAADWGTDTKESLDVAREMGAHHPDYTIHLGDTYFVGAPHEIKQNFVDKGSPWVRGSKGSFAVLGNHEMYARGIAFFKRQLPTLGIKADNGEYTGQKAGFFCLENDYWRILGLDTGYHSIGKIPIIEMIPWFAPDCHFDKKLIAWLYEQLRLDDPNDKRGLVILTHHQYISAFKGETEYLVPAEQLAKIIGRDRPVIWIWGHEHKLSVYEKARVNNGIAAYGRCIGHGGMPVELESDGFTRDTNNHGNTKLMFVDKRRRTDKHDWPLGYNGYALLLLKNEQLDISYHDVDKKLVSEHWEADLQSGIIKGSVIIHVPES